MSRILIGYYFDRRWSQGSRIREYQNKDAICHLESLEQLDLGENEIDSLPLNFGALTKLRELWLDTNDIKVLPQSIGGLKDLSIADFANNKIEVIPETIEGCIRIGFFYFHKFEAFIDEL